jgi:hypothetical protein
VVLPFGAPPSPFGAVDRLLPGSRVSFRAFILPGFSSRSDEEVRALSSPSSTASASSPAPPRRTDRSPWNWLLILPIVLPVLTPLFNFDSPRLWGFPAFYWLQFAFILVGVATTATVYRMTRAKRPTVPQGDRDE